MKFKSNAKRKPQTIFHRLIWEHWIVKNMLANNKYPEYPCYPSITGGGGATGQLTEIIPMHSMANVNGGVICSTGNAVGVEQQQLPPMVIPKPKHKPPIKSERESIHSGQFMVSTFEAEEAQDDLIDDTEIKMLDPEDPSLSRLDGDDGANGSGLEVQLYVPRKCTRRMHSMIYDGEEEDEEVGGSVATGSMAVTSQLEIETSLTKLFKCMNLAYRSEEINFLLPNCS